MCEELIGDSDMAEIILIHGMAQEQETADSLESKWLPALAGGVRAAGDDDLADRIWRKGQVVGEGIDVRMAAYGDLFLSPGAQGNSADLSTLGTEGMALAHALASEWLNRAAERDAHPDHDTAVLELGYLEDGHEVMGLREERLRTMINALARLRWFAIGSMSVAERVKKPLHQVTKYLTDSDLRDSIQQRVLKHIGTETKVIIGHSLGSVVAYDIAAKRLSDPLPLLLTLGSPLGLRSIIYDRLEPQPPQYPPIVQRWVNIADRNDLVAAEPDLSGLFGRGNLGEATIESGWTVDNGAKPHQAESYLGKKEIGRPILAVFRPGEHLTMNHDQGTVP